MADTVTTTARAVNGVLRACGYTSVVTQSSFEHLARRSVDI
jgi:hypothetical protein